MARIYLGIYGIGAGHSIRCLRLAKELYHQRHELILSTFGDGKRIFSDQNRSLIFRKIYYTSDYEYGWTSKGLSWKDTISRSLVNINTLRTHLSDELLFMKSSKPDIVISDSRVSSILASSILNIPSLLITNQLSIRSTFNLVNSGIGMVLPRIWKMANKIVVQDLPPPFTITYSNIYPYLNLYDEEKVHFIGLLENYDKVNTPLDGYDRDIDILFFISAPTRDRINFFKTLYTYLFSLNLDNNLEYKSCIVEGNPKKRETRQYGNLRYVSWVDNPYDILRRSRIVVLRGGQTSILESILMNVPMIIMPAVNQTEQTENARRVEELGIGKYLDYKLFIKNKNVLWDFVENIFENYDWYINNLRTVRKQLIISGGIKKAIGLIKELMEYGEVV